MAYYNLYGEIKTLHSNKEYAKYTKKYKCKIFIKEKEFDPCDPEIAICKTLLEINSKEINNIVTIYDVYPSKIILEYLPTILITENEMKDVKGINESNNLCCSSMKQIKKMNKEVLKSSIENARVYLNDIGIVYIDYKLDNIGMDSNGNYKLFDFDASGIVNKNENKWMIEPPNYFVYKKLKQLYSNTIKNKLYYDIYAIQLFFTDIETICLD